MTFDRSGSEDQRAIDRYRYMVSTAPPEDVEQAHEEAFARLSPEQRRQVLEQLAQHVPPSEIRGDDPKSLARTATRAEMRDPGVLERAWSGPGLGSMFFATLAGSFIGSAIAQQFFFNDAMAADSGDTGSDGGDAGDGGDGGDYAGADSTGESGYDGGDTAGDFGGGDFGGGDFGGGDLGGF
jgi:hypothetical protein